MKIEFQLPLKRVLNLFLFQKSKVRKLIESNHQLKIFFLDREVERCNRSDAKIDKNILVSSYVEPAENFEFSIFVDKARKVVQPCFSSKSSEKAKIVG